MAQNRVGTGYTTNWIAISTLIVLIFTIATDAKRKFFLALFFFFKFLSLSFDVVERYSYNLDLLILQIRTTKINKSASFIV